MVRCVTALLLGFIIYYNHIQRERGRRPHRQVRELDPYSRQCWQHGVEVDVAEGDYSDGAGGLNSPAPLQGLQGAGAKQTQRVPVQLRQVAVGEGQALNTAAPRLHQPAEHTHTHTHLIFIRNTLLLHCRISPC